MRPKPPSSHSYCPRKFVICPQVYLQNAELPRSAVQYLGLYIDKRLACSTRVNTSIKREIHNNRFKQLCRCRRSKLPHHQLLNYSFTNLLHPIWMFGGQIYGCTNPSVLANSVTFHLLTLRSMP